MRPIIFNSSRTKPRIHSVVALLGVATAFDIIIMVLSKGVIPGAESISHLAVLQGTAVINTLCFLLVVARLVQLLVGQLRYNPYSYNTIFYAGFALFFLSVAVTHTAEVPRALLTPDQFNEATLVFDYLNSARFYMLLSAPFVLLFSGALCVSNVALIRHEGFRPVNALGIVLAFMLVAGEIALFCFDYYVSGSLEEVRLHELVGNLFAAVYLYVECMVIGTMVAGAIVSRHEPPYDRDFLIILGCGIRSDGTPTPLLAGRVDRALEFDRAQREETGHGVTFVPSGGQGPDEVVSESESMSVYLVGRGIEANRIIREDQSTSTFENMRLSKNLIDEATGDDEPKVAFSTTNYHVFRAGLFARRVGMRAEGIGAPTRWWFWPNAAVREFVGLLTEHRGKQLAILVAMMAAYTVMTLILFYR